MENPIKMDNLGVPLFSETSIQLLSLTLKSNVFFFSVQQGLCLAAAHDMFFFFRPFQDSNSKKLKIRNVHQVQTETPMAHTFHLQFAYFPLPSYSLPQSSTTNTSCYFCPLRLIQSFAPKSLFCIFPTCRFISATVCASIVSPAGHRDVRSWRLRLRPIAPSVLRLRRGRSFGALAPSVALRPAILTDDLKAEPAKVLMNFFRNLIWLLLLLLGWWWWWWWWWWWCWCWWWWWWWWRFSKTHCYVTILQEQDCQKKTTGVNFGQWLLPMTPLCPSLFPKKKTENPPWNQNIEVSSNMTPFLSFKTGWPL